MNTVKESEFYRTTDLSLSAALFVCGYPLEALDRHDPSRVVFIFKRNEFLDDVVKLFLTHELKVDAGTYFNALKEIKGRIYNIN